MQSTKRHSVQIWLHFQSGWPLLHWRGSTAKKRFVAKLHAAWYCDAIEQVAPSKGVLFNKHNSTGHFDHPEMATALPSLGSNCRMPASMLTWRMRGTARKGTGGDDPCLVHWHFDRLRDVSMWTAIEGQTWSSKSSSLSYCATPVDISTTVPDRVVRSNRHSMACSLSLDVLRLETLRVTIGSLAWMRVLGSQTCLSQDSTAARNSLCSPCERAREVNLPDTCVASGGLNCLTGSHIELPTGSMADVERRLAPCRCWLWFVRS